MAATAEKWRRQPTNRTIRRKMDVFREKLARGRKNWKFLRQIGAMKEKSMF
jgi:hypothetical protein